MPTKAVVKCRWCQYPIVQDEAYRMTGWRHTERHATIPHDAEPETQEAGQL